MALAAPVESASEDRAALRELSRRRDAPGLVRLGVQWTLLVVTGLAAVRLAAAGNAAWPLATVACGLALLPFFAILHEAGHQTAFRTHALNEGAVWIGALVNLQAPSFFREFHWEHHRSTQDREHDPEIAKAPELLDDWPGDPLRYLLLASGQPLLVPPSGGGWCGRAGLPAWCWWAGSWRGSPGSRGSAPCSWPGPSATSPWVST
jgi:fatty acid desaturase